VVTKTVSIKKLNTPEGVRWRVRWSESGKDRSARHETKDKAEAHAAELRLQKETRGEVWLSLSAYERNNLISAYNLAAEKGVDIHKAIMAAAQNGNASQSLGIGKVIEELKTSRLNNGRAPDYVTSMGIVLNQFARGRETMEISRITMKDVEAFMDSKRLQYRQTLRGRLSTLFNFAIRRGYRSDNPCTRLESIKVTRLPPAVFTIAQVETAVKWLLANAKHGLPWFGLSTFCGLRPEEAEQTTKADIHFAECFIRVEAQTTKVRQRRIVYPRPEAMAFVKWSLKQGSLPLSSGERRWILSGREGKSPGLRGALGFKVWPKDITRHTAASYWLAGKGETVEHVAKMLGHSESVCESRYKAVKTQKEAAEFWEAVKALK
jgi:integrase